MQALARWFFAALSLTAAPAFAHSLPRAELAIAVEPGSAAQWTLEAITAQGLMEKHNLALDIQVVPDAAAAQAALAAGDVDIIAADFVWVSAQRSAGNKVTMVPDALATGDLVGATSGGIAGIADITGAKLAVAGGASSGAWVILNAAYAKQTGAPLADAASAKFVPVVTIDDLLASGDVTAALTTSSQISIASLQSMLTDLGATEQPPFSGWAFTDATAKSKKMAIVQFLDASFEANDVLLADDAAWEPLKTVMGAPADPLFLQRRDSYRAAIVATYNPSNTAAAKAAFKLIAQFAGADLVGGKTSLDAGTFWRGYRK